MFEAAKRKWAAAFSEEWENDGSQRFNPVSLRNFALRVAVAVLVPVILGANPETPAQTFTVIHSFTGPDGELPGSRLIMDTSGNLYGTTTGGGSFLSGWSFSQGPLGYGTVFKIDPSGHETVLYNFTGGDDGAHPYAGLVQDGSGNLYGTTVEGGAAGYGTVFKLDPSGNETVLHSFTGGADGGNPGQNDVLVRDASGNLYGTTLGGGAAGYGTVFKIDPSGNEAVLHSFSGGSDGGKPYAGVVRDAAGNLYGTASSGGSSTDCSSNGCGVVFKIDPYGNETVLHSFTGGTDGAYPVAEVIQDASGSLYGITNSGAIFKVDSSGNETTVHQLDIGGIWSGVTLDARGNLYGTTDHGGNSNCFLGCGVVFKIDPSGNQSILHSFNGTDGARPFATPMIDPSGNLYGTCEGDPAYGSPTSLGNVFKIAPSVPFSSFHAKLDTRAGPPPGFQLQAFFTQGAGAPAIDPVAQGMTLTVGTYTVTIPRGAFHQTKKGWRVYEGTIGEVTLDVRISQTGANSYELQIEGSGVDLTSLTNPVTVTLILGNNVGTIQVNQ